VNNANVATATSTPQDVDTKAPQLSSISPLDNGINIAKGSNIVLTFDEKVIAGTGNLVVSNGTDTQTISVKDATQVSISDNLLTINPSNDLLENSNYTVTIASGVLSDSLGNAFAGLTSKFKTVAPITANDVVLTAKAIDGYLKSANVYADANGDGIQNASEASAITDANGTFKLVNAKGSIVVSGGTDLSTGKAFAGTLKAPEGSSVITPLTTVQQGFIEAGQTPEQAEQSVAKAFGFDASKVDLTTYDPIAEVVKAGTTGATSSIAAQMMASSAQIANFMVTAGQVLQGAAGGSGNLSVQNAGAALLKSLVSAIASDAKTGDGAINLGDAALLKSVLVEGAKEANAQAQKEAQATGTTAPKFDAANFTDKIDKMADTVTTVLKSAADNIVIAVNNSKGGDALALLSNMDKVSAFAQNDAGASLQKIATTLDTKDTTALNAALKSQSDLFTGDAATKSIESKVVETQKAVGDVIAADAAAKAAAEKAAADAKAAADKATADAKAAADKLAADQKAAADKAVADAKAATDKLAADQKVAADAKAAADKLAADQKAAQDAQVAQEEANYQEYIRIHGTRDNPVNTETSGDDFINGNQGSITGSLVTFTANGRDIYIFNAVKTTALPTANVKINSFSASTGDKLYFNVSNTANYTEVNARYKVSDNGTDVTLIANDEGSVQLISLIGLSGDRTSVGGAIDSITELNTFLGNNAISLI
jgi:regulator of protease activity HflC (stomatin/prohibitin superfamily)